MDSRLVLCRYIDQTLMLCFSPGPSPRTLMTRSHCTHVTIAVEVVFAACTVHCKCVVDGVVNVACGHKCRLNTIYKHLNECKHHMVV